MNYKRKAVLNWSGGKDSALALHKILNQNEIEVVSLLTVVNKVTQKSSMHNIPIEILELQAESTGIPIYIVEVEEVSNNYENKMKETIDYFKNNGVSVFIFGDIFLEDIKSYRESKLNPEGIEVIEPLWNKTSEEVIEDLIESGIKSKIIVTQADKLDISFIGKDINQNTVDSFPAGIDICGEKGEYHTLAYDGDIFKKKINFSMNRINNISYQIKEDDGIIKNMEFWVTDIIPI
jgi:uncharacterized protein (TIGR00290 family)